MAERKGTDRPEGDVIRPGLTRVHAVMARGAAEGADDGIRPQHLACVTHRFGAARQVNAVKPVAFGKPDMGLDHHRHVAFMGHGAQAIGGAAQRTLVRPRQRKAPAAAS